MLGGGMAGEDDIPVRFTARERSWRGKPAAIIDGTDWAAAVEAARREGEGFGPVRGLRRLGTRVLGTDIVPRTRVREGALEYELDRFAGVLGRSRVEPSLRLRGLEPEIVQGRTGRVLDREAAARLVVASLVGLRFSIVSGGIACVAGCGAILAVFPALLRYDSRRARE